MNAQERSLRGRLGAYTLHSQRDPKETTLAARTAFMQKFLDEVDPQHELPECERQRRAEAARKAHFVRMALRSAKKRARK